jgi:hypothetical protein
MYFYIYLYRGICYNISCNNRSPINNLCEFELEENCFEYDENCYDECPFNTLVGSKDEDLGHCINMECDSRNVSENNFCNLPNDENPCYLNYTNTSV